MKSNSVTNKTIIKFGLICLVAVLILVFLPIIPEPKECFTTPCPQFISVSEAINKLDFSSELPVNPNPVEDDGFCIEIFQPVCGTDGKTYSNQCFLDLQEEVELDHIGEC